jgi:hypothetical protein
MAVGHASDDVHVGRGRPCDVGHDARILGVRWLAGQGHPTRRDEALEILRQRYARGDIDKQEFDTRKRDLSP